MDPAPPWKLHAVEDQEQVHRGDEVEVPQVGVEVWLHDGDLHRPSSTAPCKNLVRRGHRAAFAHVREFGWGKKLPLVFASELAGVLDLDPAPPVPGALAGVLAVEAFENAPSIVDLALEPLEGRERQMCNQDILAHRTLQLFSVLTDDCMHAEADADQP